MAHIMIVDGKKYHSFMDAKIAVKNTWHCLKPKIMQILNFPMENDVYEIIE